MITLLTLFPLFGGLAVLALSRARTAARALAVLVSAVALVMAILLWRVFDPSRSGMQFQEIHEWAPSLGIAYHVGVDGLGVLMVTLAAMVTLTALIAAWSNKKLTPVCCALMLFLDSGMFGTFTALNFVHWFIFWELSLIPAFFLIRLYGGSGRARAGMQFFLYTMVGSIALLLTFLALFLATGRFDFVDLAQLAQSGQLLPSFANLHWFGNQPGSATHVAQLLFWAAFLGFAVKTPVVPFHTWLPAAYAEAPSEVTMLLTGAMSKMGIYGFLRILLPIFPRQMQHARTPLLVLAVATIVLPAFAAWAQKDLKRTFAYSSINHLGYCILGICAVAQLFDTPVAPEKAAALTGVLLQVFSHALVATTLFWMIALLERRTGGLRGIDDFGGLRRLVPVFTGLMGIAIFASLGLPGLSGFPGEFLIFKGSFPLAAWATAVSVLGLLMTAVFLLTVIQKVFSGPVNTRWQAIRDLTAGEMLTLAPAIALMFVLGIYPQLITGMIHATVAQWAMGVGF